ncbi:MAG: hypothetical protein U1F21_08155 [Sphaerotilus natans]
MLAGMSKVLDALWRAIGYCLLPRVILLSFVPVLLLGTCRLRAGLVLLGSCGRAAVRRRWWSTRCCWATRSPGWTAWTAGCCACHRAAGALVALSVPVLIIASLLAVSALMGRRSSAWSGDAASPT